MNNLFQPPTIGVPVTSNILSGTRDQNLNRTSAMNTNKILLPTWNIRKTLFALSLLCLFLLFPFQGQSQTSSADFVGQWKIDYATSYAEIDSVQSQRLSQLTEAHRDKVKANYETMVFDFDQSGTFTITRGANSVNGSWSFNQTNNLFTLTYSSGTVFEYSLVDVQATSLRIKLTNSFQDSIILKELFLIKQ